MRRSPRIIGPVAAWLLVPPAVADDPTPAADVPRDLGLDGTLAIRPADTPNTPEPPPDETAFVALQPIRLGIGPGDGLGIGFDAGLGPLDAGALSAAGLPTLAAPESADGFRVRLDRETNLIDGGVGQSPEGEDDFADSRSDNQRFSRYSLSVEWTPAPADAAWQWLVVGGLHAVRADIGRLDPATLTLDEARGAVAVPTVGTGLRWSPLDAFAITTVARTHSVESSASLIDLVISAELRLSPGVGLSAGYEFYESDLTVESVHTTIDREGYFARLTIRF